MADTKLSNLPSASSPVSVSDLILVDQGGVSKKALVSDLPFSDGGGTVTAGFNEGSGAIVFDNLNSTSTILHFKTLIAGSNVTLTPSSNTLTIAATTSSLPTKESLGANFNNQGSAIIAADANVAVIQCPFAGTIVGWTILTEGGTGSCQIDIWKSNYASYPPNIGNTITASSLPVVTSGIKGTDATLTGWTTSVLADDIFAFKLNSSSTFTEINIILKIQPS